MLKSSQKINATAPHHSYADVMCSWSMFGAKKQDLYGRTVYGVQT